MAIKKGATFVTDDEKLNRIASYYLKAISSRDVQIYLNPILVWFQPHQIQIKLTTFIHFQSHLGLISTIREINNKQKLGLLSIPSWSDFNLFGDCCRFWRLLLSIPSWSDFNVVLEACRIVLGDTFQSHLGLISTERWIDVKAKDNNFQSHLGLISTNCWTV